MSYKEYPRRMPGKEIMNEGELHLLVVLLIDTSGSMEKVKLQLAEGLRYYKQAIDTDPLALGRVETCIICFDDSAIVKEAFGSAYELRLPDIDCGGMTAMHEAVSLGLDQIDDRINEYAREGTPYYRPWIFLLTDGKPNDPDNGSFDRLLQLQNSEGWHFYPIAIGDDCDLNLLGSMQINGEVLHASRDSFAKAFGWMSKSIVSVSRSQPGEGMSMPNPGEYQLDVVRV